MEVVDFVLEDAGVPAGGEDGFFFGVFVQVGDANLARAGDEGGKAGEAEAAFEELDVFNAEKFDFGVDDDVERDGGAFFFFQVGGWDWIQEVFAVFDHG